MFLFTFIRIDVHSYRAFSDSLGWGYPSEHFCLVCPKYTHTRLHQTLASIGAFGVYTVLWTVAHWHG